MSTEALSDLHLDLPPNIAAMHIDEKVRSTRDRYRTQILIKFRTHVSIKQLQAAFAAIIEQNEALRVAVVEQDGKAHFAYHERVSFSVEEFELDHSSDELLENGFFGRTMDLTRPPLMRAALLRLSTGADILAVDIHRTIADGIGCFLLLLQLDALIAGKQISKGTSFGALMRNGTAVHSEHSPQDALAEETTLPEDRHGRKGIEADAVVFPLERGLWIQLETVAAQHNLTASTLARAMFNIILSRIVNGNVPVWTGAQWRRTTDDYCTIANSSMNLRTRFDVRADESLVEAARRYEKARKDAIDGGQARQPRFNEPLYVFEIEDEHLELEKRKIRPVFTQIENWNRLYPHEPSWDLLLRVTPPSGSNGGSLALIYDTAIFSAARTKSLLAGYRNLLRACSATPTRAVGKIELSDEMHALAVHPVDKGDETAFPSVEARLDKLFDAIKRRWPRNRAIIWPNGSQTFSELAQHAATLQQELRQAGVSHGDIVGVFLRPMFDNHDGPMYPALCIALLEIGAVIAPIGRETSIDLLKTMLEIGCCGYLVTNVAELQNGGLARYREAQDLSHLKLQPATLLKRETPDSCKLDFQRSPGRPAFLLFSSGSTGLPKPILQSSEGLYGLLRGLWLSRLLPRCRSLMGANIGFDVVFADLWLPWISGEAAVILDFPNLSQKDLAEARRLGVGLVSTSPTLAEAIIAESPACFEGFNTIVVTGEECSADLANRLRAAFPGTRFVDPYGPTETCVYATAQLFDFELEHPVPIGHALPGYEILIADPQSLTATPACWPGEILIGPPAPCLGYLDMDERNTKSFVRLKTVNGSVRQFYRSGDVGWIDEQGLLRYGGRNDRQIQLGGIRVELSGVEACLRSADFVDNAAVVPIGSGGRRLAAFVKLRAGAPQEEITRKILREIARRSVPRPAVPAVLHFVSDFPRGASDKINYQELTRRAEAHQKLTGLKALPRAGTTEHQLALLWAPLVGRKDIGSDDDFFSVGGTSFQALRLSARIAEHFKVKIPPDLLFLHTLLSEQSALIDARKETAATRQLPSPRPVSPFVELELLRPAPERASYNPIVGFPTAEGDTNHLAFPARHLARDRDFWVLRLTPKGQALAVENKWFDLALAFAEAINQHPPGHFSSFVGFSAGGWLAWLTERILTANDNSPPIALLSLDSGIQLRHPLTTRDRIDEVLIKARSIRKERMLLCARPPKVTGIFDLMQQWQGIGVNPELLSIGTVIHDDLFREPVLKSIAPIISAWLNDKTIRSDTVVDIPGEALGPYLYRIATSDTPMDVNALARKLVSQPSLPYWDKMYILFIATQEGELGYASNIARELLQSDPKNDMALYALLALLAARGERSEAEAILQQRKRDNPGQAAMAHLLESGVLSAAPGAPVHRLEVFSSEAFDWLLAHALAKQGARA